MDRSAAALRQAFLLEPGALHLNHGAFGATPLPVLAEAERWRIAMERQPMRFMLRELPVALRAVAAALAGTVGSAPEDLVLLENASSGVCAVLRSTALGPGDRVLMFDQGYPACLHAARHVCERAGAELVLARLPFPGTTAAEVLALVCSHLDERVKLAILDHIPSGCPVVLPARELVRVCHEAGVPVLVDGAHAPGMIPLDLAAIGADYYVGNCHKWLFAPKGCAFLRVRPDRQEGLHPVTISHGFGQGLVAEFDWIGTRDHSPWLALPAALSWRQALGDAWIRDHNRDLVLEAAGLVAAAWGCELPVTQDMVGSMVCLAAPEDLPATWDAAFALQDRLWDDHRIALPAFPIGNRVWLRLSAQVYNDLSDYERLVEVYRG